MVFIELKATTKTAANLLASIKARLAELDRFWEREQTKADVEVFILDEVSSHAFHRRREKGRRRQRLCPRVAAGHEWQTREGGMMIMFRGYIGIDYSGAGTPTAILKGLRV